MNSGVYCWRNIINDKRYIGSAVNLIRRKSCHLYSLRRNKHKSQHFQSSYNKHGEDNFEFSVLEYIDDKTKLIEREQYWFDLYKDNTYNLREIVDSNYGKKHKQTTKDRIGAAHKGKSLTDEHKHAISNGLSNKPKSKEHREKVIKAISKPVYQIDKHTDEIIREWDSASIAAVSFGTHANNIGDACRGRSKTSVGYKWRFK